MVSPEISPYDKANAFFRIMRRPAGRRCCCFMNDLPVLILARQAEQTPADPTA
jgi:hypothetical protein